MNRMRRCRREQVLRTSSCACSLTVFRFDASTKQYLSAMPPPADPRRATTVDGGTKRREPSSFKQKSIICEVRSTCREQKKRVALPERAGSPRGLSDDSRKASKGDQVAEGAYEKRCRLDADVPKEGLRRGEPTPPAVS